MNKQPRMIDAAKAIKMIDEAIRNSNENRDECMPVWSRGEVNGLSLAKGIILSGQCAPDPIPLPAIKPGDIVNFLEGFQFPFLKNVEVDHLETHRCGEYAVLRYEGELYTVPTNRLEVIPNGE